MKRQRRMDADTRNHYFLCYGFIAALQYPQMPIFSNREKFYRPGAPHWVIGTLLPGSSAPCFQGGAPI